jgi:predicted acetyltransferase
VNLKLVTPNESHEKLWQDLIREYNSLNEAHVPQDMSGGKTDYHEYLKHLAVSEKIVDPVYVPSSTYFLMNDKAERIYGVISVRHFLTEALKLAGGHIAYSIRPSEREKGLGNKILLLGLEKCADLGINPARITIYKGNIRSAKVAINAGGKLVQEHNDNGKIIQIYDVFV